LASARFATSPRQRNRIFHTNSGAADRLFRFAPIKTLVLTGVLDKLCPLSAYCVEKLGRTKK
jgi:hypothetical protein